MIKKRESGWCNELLEEVLIDLETRKLCRSWTPTLWATMSCPSRSPSIRMTSNRLVQAGDGASDLL